MERLPTICQISATENVATLLRQAVLDGRLKPGMKLREQALCEELGVSRTPLREAFRILQAERVLEYEPYTGVKVARFSARFLRETWDIRRITESYAARLCAERFEETDRGEYEAMLAEMEQANIHDVEAFETCDEKLHFLMAKKCGNHELEQMIINLWHRTVFLRKIALYKSNRRMRASKTEHLGVLKAILEKDATAAERLMHDHFFESVKDVAASDFFLENEEE